jgi:hypothetical protein
MLAFQKRFGVVIEQLWSAVGEDFQEFRIPG